MAKDPALLFYWGDWHGGTSTFTRHLKGCYMDLLNAQFNNGHLSLDEIKTVLGSDFGSSWPALQKKFSKDSEGLFFNERMESEKLKRVKFTKSRIDNLKGKPHMDSHMDNENRNDNVIKNKKKESEIYETNFERPKIEIGKVNGHRITIFPKYVSDPIIIIHDLREYFSKEGQLEAIERAKWLRFEDFMADNPEGRYDDKKHLYNAFKKFNQQIPNGKIIRNTRSAEQLDEKPVYTDKF